MVHHMSGIPILSSLSFSCPLHPNYVCVCVLYSHWANVLCSNNSVEAISVTSDQIRFLLSTLRMWKIFFASLCMHIIKIFDMHGVTHLVNEDSYVLCSAYMSLVTKGIQTGEWGEKWDKQLETRWEKDEDQRRQQVQTRIEKVQSARSAYVHSSTMLRPSDNGHSTSRSTGNTVLRWWDKLP
jgi:hypothetical protein